MTTAHNDTLQHTMKKLNDHAKTSMNNRCTTRNMTTMHNDDVQWCYVTMNNNGWWQRWPLIPVGSYYWRANKNHIRQLTYFANLRFELKWYAKYGNFNNVPVTKHGAQMSGTQTSWHLIVPAPKPLLSLFLPPLLQLLWLWLQQQLLLLLIEITCKSAAALSSMSAAVGCHSM